MKPDSAKLLLGLAIGAAIGAAFVYVATSDKKEEWLNEFNEIAQKAKEGFNKAVAQVKQKGAQAAEIIAEE
ncbi:MAG: hypothetical protein PUB21_12395 [Bacteroidales bacterium]|nr:hypothetical protein [Bacteroidales bacterium]